MKLFDVYPLFDVEPVKGEGCYVWDQEGTRYLDLYGGHAVISIGHSHPHYITRIQRQLNSLGFYSNSVKNSMQLALAEKLGKMSGYEGFKLFLVNSGAEAIENALKLASFHTGREKVVFVEHAFHGRTAGAVAITDKSAIQAPVNSTAHASRIPFDDLDKLESLLRTETYCALVIEGIQGIGGIHVPSPEFLKGARKLCHTYGTILIMDEIQSGYGRSGQFFAHQHTDIRPDLITVAKGMGNGFPIGGVLISPKFKASYGMLGTTFGGNHLACAAGLAVLEVIEAEQLIPQAAAAGNFLMRRLASIPGVTEVRGAGLMIGIELDEIAKPFRLQLLKEHKIFTGSASDPYVLRLLPPLNISHDQAETFISAFGDVMQNKKTIHT